MEKGFQKRLDAVKQKIKDLVKKRSGIKRW
jgi:hypothetical protein